LLVWLKEPSKAAKQNKPPFAAICMNLQTADFAAVQFLAFVDAAFSRTCGIDLLAMQRISPNPPFKWNIGRPFQTDRSMRYA
jgi:hypothetical protein